MSKSFAGRNRPNAVRLSHNEGLEQPLQALFCSFVGVDVEPNRIRDNGRARIYGLAATRALNFRRFAAESRGVHQRARIVRRGAVSLVNPK